MSRYINADAIRELLIKYIGLTNGFDRAFSEAPSIDIEDYVPKAFHDKTCEALCHKHRKEVEALERKHVDIVRCKECKWWIVVMDENNTDEDYLKCNMDKWTNADDFCSYGERREDEKLVQGCR